jgi:SH3-like domain-containing protein
MTLRAAYPSPALMGDLSHKGRGDGASALVCPSLLAMTLFLFLSPLHAADKNPVPRFVSLRPSEVNARVGPGPEYPVEWIFVKAGLPVEVTAEFDTWRRIRDVEGSEGWVHQNMLCGKRRAVVCCPEALMYSEESASSAPLVRLEKGVIIEVIKCRGEWCRAQVNNYKGWIRRESLWGIYPKENLG